MFTKFFSRDISVAFIPLTFVAVAAALLFGGCGESDNPIVDEHEHEEEAPFHADADGFVLEVGGVEVYRQFQGTETGGITVGAGEEIEVHVEFLNPDGALFTPEPEGEGEEAHEHEAHEHGEEEVFALSLTGYDTTIAEVHLHGEEHEAEHGEEHEAEHDEEHEADAHSEHEEEWTFEVVGVKAGTTHITLQLLHGDHADFTAALPVPITVQ